MSALSLLIIAGVLFAVALALLAAELFLPSHGVLTTLCVLFAIAGIIVAYWAHPTVGLLAAIFLLLASPVVVYVAIRLYPQTAVGRKVILDQPRGPAVQPFEETVQTLQQLVGKEGVAMTVLRPAGTCEIEGRRIDCLAESTIIEAGSRIRVEQVQGLKVIVRQV